MWSMPDSIFYNSVGWGVTQKFYGLVIIIFLSMRKMDSVLSIQNQWAWGKRKLKDGKDRAIRQMGLISI